MVTDWITWSQASNLPLPPAVETACVSPKAESPRSNYQTAITPTSLLAGSMQRRDHCWCVPRSRGFRPSGSGMCLLLAASGRRPVESARESAPEGYFGCPAMQFALEWGRG